MTLSQAAPSTVPTPHPGEGPLPGEPWAPVAAMDRALDFYLGLGCEVRRATDGWVLLVCGAVSFALVAATEPASGSRSRRAEETVGEVPWVRLTTPDVRVLRWRLLADDVPTSVVLRPHRHATGEIHVVDPDRRTVAIEQTAPPRADAARDHRTPAEPARGTPRPDTRTEEPPCPAAL